MNNQSFDNTKLDKITEDLVHAVRGARNSADFMSAATDAIADTIKDNWNTLSKISRVEFKKWYTDTNKRLMEVISGG